MAKVGSLLGSGKLKELEADNRTLQGEVAARDESIELLQQQMERQQEEHSRQLMEMQARHRREMADKEAEHQKEVSFLKSIIQKAKKWFPLFQELVYTEKFCLKVGFNERQTATPISGKPLFCYTAKKVQSFGIINNNNGRIASWYFEQTQTACNTPVG